MSEVGSQLNIGFHIWCNKLGWIPGSQVITTLVSSSSQLTNGKLNATLAWEVKFIWNKASFESVFKFFGVPCYFSGVYGSRSSYHVTCIWGDWGGERAFDPEIMISVDCSRRKNFLLSDSFCSLFSIRVRKFASHFHHEFVVWKASFHSNDPLVFVSKRWCIPCAVGTLRAMAATSW